MTEVAAVFDPIITHDAFSETVQKAVEGVDDLYGRISNPLARDALKRRAIRDSLVDICSSYQALSRRLATLEAQLGIEPTVEPTAEAAPEPTPSEAIDAPTPLPNGFVSEHVAGMLRDAGLTTIEAVEFASDKAILDINGIGPVMLGDIRAAIRTLRGE